MHKSPSLFFDILTEEDESKRDEKIKRASFDIKSNLTSSPTTTPSPSGYQNTLALKQLQPQQQQLYQTSSIFQAAVAPLNGHHSVQQSSSATSPSQRSPQQSESPDGDVGQQQQQPAANGQQLVLSPQEVLQELLGDLFIHQDRLIMGELLGQGGFADVHAAQLMDPLLPDFSESVAVKRLRPDVLKGPDDLKEFLTEANLLRKLAHRNIVALRGVGASDLTDLVNMRESMFVVQEFMAGGDLKQLVMGAMSQPFNPPYNKSQALKWAMHIAEALHYLHCVCTPMIIHRDLKLDNILLSGTDADTSVAKLADFGLHKRVRRMVSSGTLVAWDQEATYHGADYERSYYGGNMYLNAKSALSAANSVIDEQSVHGSVGGSLHGRTGYACAAAAAAAGVDRCGKLGTVAADSPAGDCSSSQKVASAALIAGHNGNGSAATVTGPASSSVNGMSLLSGMNTVASVMHSDSAMSIGLPAAAAAAVHAPGSPGFQQQQQRLRNVVRAKSQGLLAKPDFVAEVLSAAARPELLQGPSELGQQSRDVSRTFAAVVALEGSVRAGTAFYQQQQQQQQVGQHISSTASPPAVPVAAVSALTRSGSSSTKSNKMQSIKQQLQPKQQQQSELCPQLVSGLKMGLAHAKDTHTFIEATQKVGSLMYMAPEVLTGHQYNEKIDVFSFGIILYELLSGLIIAGRVAVGGEHEDLLDYARQVANGHREVLPPNWPAPVRALISSCWAQDPAQRPGFKEVLKQLYAIKQAGVDVQMDQSRPKGGYNPVTDCGCTIM